MNCSFMPAIICGAADRRATACCFWTGFRSASACRMPASITMCATVAQPVFLRDLSRLLTADATGGLGDPEQATAITRGQRVDHPRQTVGLEMRAEGGMEVIPGKSR